MRAPSDDLVCICCNYTRNLETLSMALDEAGIAHRLDPAPFGAPGVGCLYTRPEDGDAGAARGGRRAGARRRRPPRPARRRRPAGRADPLSGLWHHVLAARPGVPGLRARPAPSTAGADLLPLRRRDLGHGCALPELYGRPARGLIDSENLRAARDLSSERRG